MNRVNGAGFAALAELAYAAGMPKDQALRPTTDTRSQAGALIIDWELANQELANKVEVASYEVHLPGGEYPATWPLDHRLVTGGFDL